jgi:putative hydrolase of the HAD superfamily
MWWKQMTDTLSKAIEQLGLNDRDSAKLAGATKEIVIDPNGFHLFDDVRPALDRLGTDGWRHIVLSNHVPELQGIVRSLGLGDVISRVLSSAITGYEKPHPEAFALALRAADNPSTVWMIGDNPDADVLGAGSAGIPAILVRTQDSRVRLSASNLLDAAEIISNTRVVPG